MSLLNTQIVNAKIATALFAGALLLSGCQWLRVYTIDVPQGTPIQLDKARQVQVGMTPEQVLYILGSPALKDALAPNRWDYIYDYTAGTDGKRAGKNDINNASQYVSIYFDQGRVARVDGLNSLPIARQ